MKLLDILNSPWAISPEMYAEIRDIYLTHLRGEKIDIDAVEKKLGHSLNNDRHEYDIINGVAVIQMHGVIAKRMNMFTKISGGVSTQIAANEFADALSNPEVTSILLDMDSPGGTVDGTQDLAEQIYESRGKKPVVAFTDGMMASAAYYIGAAAAKIYISGDMVQVGSIGVAMSHTDYSKSDEKAGIKTTEIYAGKYKRIASDTLPLSKEGRQYIQDRVDYIYSIFVRDVAKYRSVSEEKALKDMADAKVFIGTQAIKAGLVDGVSTRSRLLDNMAAGDAAVSNAVAAGDADGRIEVQTTDKGEIDMDLAKFKAEHPAIYKEALTEFSAKAEDALKPVHAKLIKEAMAEGATAERERIQAIADLSAPGHEKLIAELMYDGKSTPGDAALKVNAAEKVTRDAKAAAIAEGAAPIQDGDASDDNGEEAKGFEALVSAHMAENKCSKAQAISAIAKSHPTEHAAYIAEINKGGES